MPSLLFTHSWRAGTAYRPKCMNMPKRSCVHHAIRCVFCASVSENILRGGSESSAANADAAASAAQTAASAVFLFIVFPFCFITAHYSIFPRPRASQKGSHKWNTNGKFKGSEDQSEVVEWRECGMVLWCLSTFPLFPCATRRDEKVFGPALKSRQETCCVSRVFDCLEASLGLDSRD